MIQLSPFISFLAAQTATEAHAEWLHGPSGDLYRTLKNVPIADYIDKVRELEASPGLAGQSAAQLAQRIRRMHYSTVTEGRRKGASENMDKLISNTTYTTGFSETPPLTAPDHVTQALLDFFWSCDTVTTLRGHSLDISHVWVIVDLMLAGRSVLAVGAEGPWLDVDDIRPLLSWAGDLSNPVYDYSDALQKSARQSVPKQERIQIMKDAINNRGGVDDIIADIDAINLGNIAESLGSYLVLSDMLDRYYSDDNMQQAQAKALLKPTSARRFHYFVSFATPTIPANGASRLSSVALEVTLKRNEAIELFKTLIIDITDDLLEPYYASASDRLDYAGIDLFDQYCAHFADFLIEGLRSGDVKWPPAQWT